MQRLYRSSFYGLDMISTFILNMTFAAKQCTRETKMATLMMPRCWMNADGESDWLVTRKLNVILEATCFYEKGSVLFLQND
jgi:hypothetical protein